MIHKEPLRAIYELGPGDHLCCIYETEEEHRAAVTPFLRQGLERAERVLYIVDDRTAEVILGYLRDDGLDVEPYLDRGQLTILTRDDAYVRGGSFDPDAMIALLESEMEQALAEGYSALRVTGEMSWALRGLPGSERLVEYETKLNRFLPESRCLAICQYDQRRFDSEILLDVLRTHPIAVIGTEIYENFYYVPPEELLGHASTEAEFRRWVQNLAERKRVEEALRERVKELTCLYAVSRDLQEAASIDEACRRIVEHLTSAMQFPEITVPVVELDGKRFTSEKYNKGLSHSLRAGVKVEGETRGEVRVYYTEKRPFLTPPEQDLLNGVAEALGMWLERKRAKTALEEYSERLEEMVEERTQELREAQEQLLRREKLAVLGQLAGSINHDLRGPLGNINNVAYFLNMAIEEPGGDVQEALDMLQEEVARAETIVSSILDLLRTREPDREEVDVDHIVENVLSRIEIPQGVEVGLCGGDSLPTIIADPDQLAQVIDNLIQNAIQAMPEGGRLTVRAEEDGPGWVTLSVADTGVGIPEEDRERIFEPLFTTRAQGTGLGLALVQTLVEGHGGTIEVESEVGEGSTFTVRFPVGEEEGV